MTQLRKLHIIKHMGREQFFHWEWREIQSHFAKCRNWKYKRVYRWSYPESEHGLSDAVMWNNITMASLNGWWEEK